MSFAYPYLLWTGLVIWAGLFGLWFFLWRHKRSRLAFSVASKVTNAHVGSLKVSLRDFPGVLKWVALLALLVALARPQERTDSVTRNALGIDIVIALDVSDSMLIEDMPPEENRLEAAKKTAIDFISGRVSDRIGLVVFSGESFTRIPLTLDYDMLRQSLSEITISRTIKMGTAIGVALANAANRMSESQAKEKVIIFLTDGENNSGTIDPLTALEIVKKKGLRVYTVGIGKDGQTLLPVYGTNPFGQKVKRYQPFYSAVNEELLQKMADETGGKFYRAETALQMKQIYEEIDKLERVQIEEKIHSKVDEKFHLPLVLGLMLLLLGELLTLIGLRRFP